MSKPAWAVWNSSRLRSLVTVLAALHVVYQAFFFIPAHWNRSDSLRDTPAFYLAAQNSVNHHTLYRARPGYGPDKMMSGPYFLYLPQFAVLEAPLGRLSPMAFSRVWYGLILAAFWIFAASLARIAFGRFSLDGTLVWGLIVGATPGVYFAISTANADPMMWALVGMAIATNRRGIFFALAAQLKLYTLLPLTLAVWKEGRRVAIPASILLVIGFAAGIGYCGVQSYWQWAHWVLPMIRQGTFFPGDISLSLGCLRLARHLGWNYVSGPLPPGPRLFLSVLGVLGPVCVSYLARKQEPLKLYCYSTIASVLFSPYCWSFYIPICYPLIALFIRDSRQAWMAAKEQTAAPRADAIAAQQSVPSGSVI
ncbi:hypothetical protein CCAX7_48560 [Capsulimonas corticalis]|uniref:Uncharacterized protein n=1 Tax=Capsulimonas corticalis TaxID=2219043 RepID=A0A402CQ20_9BACT|nr:glycosyltransferase family 87 protein [Capsulimonas corticalis]BDI32805.1 hypothetical protein CCAX7_48560 [Capsulimonas corticalis]